MNIHNMTVCNTHTHTHNYCGTNTTTVTTAYTGLWAVFKHKQFTNKLEGFYSLVILNPAVRYAFSLLQGMGLSFKLLKILLLPLSAREKLTIGLLSGAYFLYLHCVKINLHKNFRDCLQLSSVMKMHCYIGVRQWQCGISGMDFHIKF
jgi:hypothetical protein